MNFFGLLKQFTDSRPGLPIAPRAHLTLETLESRLVPYSVSGSAWPHPNLITISFMPDGTSVNGHSSNLFATFNAKFGSAAAWENQILKAAQQWAQATNLNFAVVPDNGAADGSGNYQQGASTFGDIRIGGYNFGSTTIAQAYLPPPANNYSVAGDIQFNTGQPFNVGSTYDLYTVAMHEFGHALGMYHSTQTTAVMYGTYTAAKTGLTADDMSGIQSIYGGPRKPDSYDAAASNNTFATAKNITALVSPKTYLALLTNLDLSSSTDVDWYTFTTPPGSNGQLKVTITSTGLSLLDSEVLIYNNKNQLLASANGGTSGATVKALSTGSGAGNVLYVEVLSTDAIFKTGAYAMAIDLTTGTTQTAPLPNTQTPNGSPLQSGGGQALSVTPSDVLVNTTTANTQETSATGHRDVATDRQGNYVVTWQSYGQDAANGWGVYAQRFNAQGVAQGGEFCVNTTTAGDQTDPSVAMDAHGDFVIVWTSAGQDGSGLGVYAQRYNAQGVPQGSEFRVNTTTAGDQADPSVAMDGLGNFVVVWTSAGQDGSGLGVYAQRFNAQGVAQGGEFRVNSTTRGDQTDPSVAIDPLGDFVVAWSSAGQDGSGLGVYAQRFNAQGMAQGGEFRVNSTTAGDQTTPSVAMDNQGAFSVAWASDGQDAAHRWGIYGQRYSSIGVALGVETQINTTTAGDQVDPSATVDSNGNIVVTWSSYGQDAPNSWGVYGQILGAVDGAKVDDEFSVNNTTAGNQRYASVAVSPLGQAVVVWSGNGPGDGSGVHLQRFTLTGDNLDPPAIDAAPVAGQDPNQGAHDGSRPADGTVGNAADSRSRQRLGGALSGQMYSRLFSLSPGAAIAQPTQQSTETSRSRNAAGPPVESSVQTGEGQWSEGDASRLRTSRRIRSLLDPNIILY